MTKEEYSKSLDEIWSESEERKKILDRQFAMSNNAIKVGDIVTDHSGRILVQSVKYTRSGIKFDYPECAYAGNVLKKDGSIKMTRGHNPKPETRIVFQQNLIH